jgi:phosphatidylinositol alpha-1,6-mannosyltransferase
MADALMVSSSFLPGQGGIESYLAELCDSLAPRLAVLAAGERDGKKLPDNLGYPTHPFDGRLLVPGPKALKAIHEAARSEGTDKVLFGTPWPLVLLAPRLENLRYAVIVHGAEMIVPAAVPLVKRHLGRALSGADLLLPVSEYTGRAIERSLENAGLPVPPMTTLRAEVDTNRFHPSAANADIRTRYGIGAGAKVILCFGRLVPRKGVDRLIRALSTIRRAVPEATVVVAGTGPEEKKLRALGAPLGDAVVFTGRVPDEDAPGLYATADVFALPVVDRWRGLEIEGLGVVLLEAAACEVPCVTGTSGGTPEAVLDGQTGYVIDATDEAVLAGRITHLLLNPGQATLMGKAGREHVQQNFNGEIPGALETWLSSAGRA